MIEISVNIAPAVALNRAAGSNKYEPGIYYTVDTSGDKAAEHWIGPFPDTDTALEDARQLILSNMEGQAE